MKTIHNTSFQLVGSDYDFCAESTNIEKLITQVRKLAKSAEQNMEPSFIYHIIAIKIVDITTGDSKEEIVKRAPFATLCYTSDGELNIEYHLKFE